MKASSQKKRAGGERFGYVCRYDIVCDEILPVGTYKYGASLFRDLVLRALARSRIKILQAQL